MAVDQFLFLDGVPGESQDAEHTDEIDVMSWNWGCSQSGTMHMGGGGGGGKASYQDITVSKWVDSGSHALMQHCSLGTHIAEGKLTVRKAGSNPLEYYVIELKKIIITSISIGGSESDDKLIEHITLNFEEFKTEYTPQEEDGSGGAAKEFAFNIAKNATV